MRLSEIISRLLLPRFAHSMDWVQNAFDYIIKNGAERALSLAAPLSMESIHSLTDSELQAYYEQFGVAIYYPDLSRETRETMLYYLAQLYRFLGTPRAVEILCQYIMDETDVHLHVDDHLAFDDNGNLINESLLDVFDAELDVLAASLPEDTLKRIAENIIRFKNDRTELRGFSFNFDLTGGGLDSTLAYTDGGNFETFYEMNKFSNAPIPYKSTGYFSWNKGTVQLNAGYNKDVNPPLTYYNDGFTYRPTRYYEGVADQTGGSTTGLLLINNSGKLALYNGKGSAIRIQRLDYEFEPCILIYSNSDKSASTLSAGGNDISIFTGDGLRWDLCGNSYRAYRIYTSASDNIGIETTHLYFYGQGTTSIARNLDQSNSITWQRAEVIRVWNPISYESTAEKIGDTMIYTFTLDVENANQAVHVYGYCRGRDAQDVYHNYEIEADYVCTNKQFTITVPCAGTQVASQSLIITKI